MPRRTGGMSGTSPAAGLLSRSPDALPSPSYPHPQRKHAYFVFGRFQPFTIGHAKLLDVGKALAESGDADFFVFPSESVDPIKNPLPYKEKIKYMRLAFPQYKIYSVAGIPKKNPAHSHSPYTVRDYLRDVKGYEQVTWVVGSDRSKPMKDMSTMSHPSLKRNSVAKKGDISKVSGTMVRQLAKDGDFDAFKKNVAGDDDKWKRRVFDKLRAAMTLKRPRETSVEASRPSRAAR